MSSISSIFNILDNKQKQILTYALNEGISKHIEFTPGRFIGVNAKHISYLTIEQSNGPWSIGTINAVLSQTT